MPAVRGNLAWVSGRQIAENGIFDQRDSIDAAQAHDLPARVFYASRRKRWRGAMMIAAAIGAGVLILLREPALDFRDPVHIGVVAVTWALFFWVAAQGIERIFEPLPTLAARADGLILFPGHDPEGVVPWPDIRRIEMFRFGKSRISAPFVSIVVDDPEVISRHLPWHLRIAYRIDRWAVRSNRYFRPRSDFDRPVDEVVAELEAWRIAGSGPSDP